MKDLIVIVADSYQEKVIEALLPRLANTDTSVFSYDIIRNPLFDSGSYNDSHELLRPSINQYSHALVIFDHEGSGVEHIKNRKETEEDVEKLLSINGWNGRNAVVVIDPELENWMWIDSPHVESAIAWEGLESLYIWARSSGKIAHGEVKPFRPKEALEQALRLNRTAKSSAIYKRIAARVSYRSCIDPAFLKLISVLKAWFPSKTA